MVKKVAVVGSGISGLVCAHWLTESGFEVSIFEKQNRLGFNGHSVAIENGASGAKNIDVPLRLLNPYQWPLLAELYKRLGIATVEVDVSQAFSDFNQKCYLKISGNGLFGINPSQLLNQRARSILSQIYSLRDKGSRDLQQKTICQSTTFLEWLNASGFSEDFCHHFLFPVLSSTVCTCSYAALERYPAIIILDALARITRNSPGQNHFLFRTKFGSDDVVERLQVNINQINVGQEVHDIRRHQDGVELYCKSLDASADSCQLFDYTVLATQANQAARFLPQSLRRLLERIEYETVEVVIHRDRRFLPEERKDWATFNYLSKGRRACCSIWLNQYYDDLAGVPYDCFQTINPVVEPAHHQVIRRIKFQRPVVTTHSFEMWQQISESYTTNGQRIWPIGSYATPGIPLLENGVCSSFEVVDAIKNTNQGREIVRS